jgi:antitoxin (DNA-binding transcriptional repressor) of toxin-antitoxin stability system
MRTLDLNDLGRQFSDLVREIQETGEGVIVLQDGLPAIRMLPAEEKPARPDIVRQRALEKLIESLKNPGRSAPDAPHLTRDEMHER